MRRSFVEALERPGASGRILVRGDSAYGSGPVVSACRAAGANFSLTLQSNPKLHAAIDAITPTTWTPVRYPGALYDEQAQQWISDAEVAETTYTAFESTTHKITARLVVRRVRETQPRPTRPGGTLPALAASRVPDRHRPTHRGRRPDPPRSRHRRTALRRPHRRTPGPPTLGPVRRQRRLADPRRYDPQPHPCRPLPHRPWYAKARAATVRRHLINTPARLAHRARRVTLHLMRVTGSR
jgi:Transposase DDE domain group 1